MAPDRIEAVHPGASSYASGLNYNVCFVVPEWSLVIVRMGVDENPEFGKHNVYNGFIAKLRDAMVVTDQQPIDLLRDRRGPRCFQASIRIIRGIRRRRRPVEKIKTTEGSGTASRVVPPVASRWGEGALRVESTNYVFECQVGSDGRIEFTNVEE